MDQVKFLVFVAGIHGVGKSSFCAELSMGTGAKHLTASALIRRIKSEPETPDKRVHSVDANQDILLHALASEPDHPEGIILDGHFCLLKGNSKIQEISINVFRAISPRGILILTENPGVIATRLTQRDGNSYPIELLHELQEKEYSAAVRVSKELDIPIVAIPGGMITKQIVSTVRSWLGD